MKAEEVVKEREKRSTYTGSATSEFRSRCSQRTPAQSSKYISGQQNTN